MTYGDIPMSGICGAPASGQCLIDHSAGPAAVDGVRLDRPSHTASVGVPGLYRCVIRHERHETVRHAFEYRMSMWLVDVNHLPEHGRPLSWLMRFRSADHLGDPSKPLGENVRNYLGLNGIDATGGKILMLAQARGLGYVFDPASFFWCHDRNGHLIAVIVEVRNTFGERHCYLVRPDEFGRATTDKAFYVSPFLPVDGRYIMRFHLDETQASATVVLRRRRDDKEQTTLVATVRGQRIVRSWMRAWLVWSHPFASRKTIVVIYWQSLRLRLAGLRPSRRRYHPPQAGVTVLTDEATFRRLR